ncbi:UNKNOWN [Stylonychia lemnae]|uniref:Uncharacterized protein n=1 Tax=Stylonychia lemnae TaxID=5949 RepID=A0A078B370_STYLE|nr:UNKNOWN [Stylonychia lemnae]|eukprot:CDW88879.1 UNKNOWN [Stylonychia lemnae]
MLKLFSGKQIVLGKFEFLKYGAEFGFTNDFEGSNTINVKGTLMKKGIVKLIEIIKQ